MAKILINVCTVSESITKNLKCLDSVPLNDISCDLGINEWQRNQ